ncbi:hypothetical protein OIY81_1137 [Cryptosporidium canis]|nr:hypothetical protein OIY81_1137 [Cryptosporidium canis]
MATEDGSIIRLPAEIINRKELSGPGSQRLSQFWTVNNVLNSLFSSSSTHKNGLLADGGLKGSIFGEIRAQMDIIVNNLSLVRLNERDGSSRFLIWKELGSSVSEFVTELLEKWDARLCELQYHHLSNCEVAFSELASEFQQADRKVQGIHLISQTGQSDDMWGDEQLFWEIDSVYPLRELQFGKAHGERVCSSPITIVYLSSILHPYLSIWSNIRSFFNILLKKAFLVDPVSVSSIEAKRIELNVFILETLFGNVEKSILTVDEYMLNIWVSLLRKCIDSFIKLIPSTPSPLKEFPSGGASSSCEFHDCICILHDILSNYSSSKTSFLDSVGNIFGIPPRNEISTLESVLRTIQAENLLQSIPAELLSDVHFQNQSKAFPIEMLFSVSPDHKDQPVQRRYTFEANIGGRFKDLSRNLKVYYKEQFIKEDKETPTALQNSFVSQLVASQAQCEGHQGIRIIDVLSCLRDLVILEESSTEQLIKALHLDSKRRFPNIDVDPTEANLSIKLLSSKGITDEEKEQRRKIMSMFLLEFEAKSSNDYVKDQLPTFHSLKIRLQGVNVGLSSASSSISSGGIPNYLISQFLNKEAMEEYSHIFSFLLESKRCSILLNQVFQMLMEINRERQGILLCKQKTRGKALHDFDYAKFCNNNCWTILNWVDSLLHISQKIRFSIQFVLDAYYSYFSMQSPVIWQELQNNLSSWHSISFMVESHNKYIEKLHLLTLAPNKRSSHNLSIDQSFQAISISFVLLMKLSRKLNILTMKISRLVHFLSSVNNAIRDRKHIPCMILRRKVQQTVKKVALAFEILYSEFNESREQLIGSLDIYIQSNPDKGLEFLLLQLSGQNTQLN